MADFPAAVGRQPVLLRGPRRLPGRDRAACEELGRKLADRLGRGELDIDRYDAAIGALDKRLASLRARRKALGTGPARVPVDTEAAWRARWEKGAPEDRRRWLGIALNGTRLVVGPARDRRVGVAARVTVG